MADPQQSYAPANGGLVRSLWTFIGHAVLLVLALYIFEKQTGRFSIFAGFYLFSTALIILFRSIDIRFLKGEPAHGKPVSTAHLRRYICFF